MQPAKNKQIIAKRRVWHRIRRVLFRLSFFVFIIFVVVSLWLIVHRRPISLPAKSHPVAVVDAGHGSFTPIGTIDIGAECYQLYEADIVLDIAKRLQFHLEQKGWVAVTTRDGKFIPFQLHQRSEMAALVQADVFVSIHLNSHHSTRPRGVSVFYWRSEDEMLAELLQKRLSERLALYNRGIATAPFTVLATSSVPAVLVELAFISNPREAKRLRNPVFREKAAKILADALTEWWQTQKR